MGVGKGGVSRQFSPSRKSHCVAGLMLETVAMPEAMNSSGW